MSTDPSASGGSSSEPPIAIKIAEALRDGAYDPQHAGELFLRADAEQAIRAALGSGARIAVAGRESADIRSVSFMGARFSPDLVVESGDGRRIAVTITLLRNDTGAIPHTLAGALVLSSRFGAVVAFVLDRRLAKADPFASPDDPREVRGLAEGERQLIEQLWQRHHVRVEIKRQDPFGWG